MVELDARGSGGYNVITMQEVTMNAIRTRIIRIGNSRGIRIPKVIIDRLGLADEVEIDVQEDQLIIRPGCRPRADWSEQFRAMAEAGDDKLLDEPTSTEFDREEWQW
jgi:antitoxin MazE